jgi:PAS domain S-box-containing protein
VAYWGRILLGGLGCFLLAWAGLVLAGKLGGPSLWLVDALLLFLVLDRSGRVLDGLLLAGGAGILLACLLVTRAFVAPALLVAVASLLHVAIGRFLLIRFAPAAPRLETPAALARLLLWCALLSPLAGALVMAGMALAGDGSLSMTHAFISWWGASAVGTAILLPSLLAQVHSAPMSRGGWRSRWGEALLVLGLAVLVGAMAWHSSGFPLLLGLTIVLWAALRLDFRTTSLLGLVLGLGTIIAAAVRVWPFSSQVQETTPLTQELQAYLLVIVVPALFASLYAQQQRAADRARLAALEALQAVVDAVPSAVMTLTQGGKVGLWNRGAERIFGWRKAEVEGRDPPFVAPEEAAHDASLKARVLAGNEIQNQPARRRERTGAPRDVMIAAAPQRNAEGAVTGIIAVMEDVTDRRRLESSREQNRAHLAAILDAVADPIITIDEDGSITSFSRAAEAVFGYSAPEVIGRNVTLLMPEPHGSQHDAYLRRYRETGVRHMIGTSREFAARRKDGTIFPAEITISEAWLDGHRIFAGIMRDLTAKPATAAMATAPAAPDQTRFLSRITHDLRQPLHALSLMTGVLERRAKDPGTREIADDLSRLVRQVEGTFENIVDWTRIESGQVGAASAAIPAGDVLAAAAQEYEAEAARRKLCFRSVPSRAMVRCDPALLRRILRQLLDNAIKYTPSGTVLLGARRRGSLLRFVVADSGIGIPTDQQDAIFAEYSQLDAGREVGGLGLGLAIARRLAALAGLTVGVRSTPGKGSQFWVDVPLAG